MRFPHKGFVRIGNNVEVSSNCSIARGSLSDTIINDGTKLDALVHVAHNVTIGRDCELTAGTVIGGSTILGIGERAERLLIVALVGMIPHPDALSWAMIIVSIVAGVTLAQRIAATSKKLSTT